MQKVITQTARYVASFAAGISVAIAGGAVAEYATQLAKPDECPLTRSAENAVNNNIRMIAMTSVDPGKYFNAGSPDSCLGGMAIANLDLSMLIPDPLGLLSIGIDGLIDGLKKAAIGAACAAVRNSVGDVIGKYNNAIGSINGELNVQGKIDSAIGDASRQMLDGYALNWKTPQANVLGAAQVSNVPVKLPAVPGVTVPATVSQSAPTPDATASSAGSPSGLGAAIFK